MVKNQLLFILIISISLLVLSCSENENSVNPEINGSSFLAIAGFSTLSFLDFDSKEFITGTWGLGNSPNWILPDANKLYVINSLSNDLSTFSYSDSSINYDQAYNLGLQQNRNPYAGLIINEKQILITNLLENSVSVFDIDTKRVQATWPVGKSPQGIAYSNGFVFVVNTGYDFVLNEYNNGSIYRLNLSDGVIMDSLSLGYNPQFIAVDNDGNLHITCTGNYDDIYGEIWVLNSENFAVISQTITQYYPGRIAGSDWHRMYIAAGGWMSEGAEYGITLSYDITNPEIISVIQTGFGTIDVSVDNDNQRVFAACMDSRRVDELRSDTLYATYSTQDSPLAIAIWNVTD